MRDREVQTYLPASKGWLWLVAESKFLGWFRIRTGSLVRRPGCDLAGLAAVPGDFTSLALFECDVSRPRLIAPVASGFEGDHAVP